MYQDSLLFPNTSSHLFLPEVTSRVHGGKHLETICCFYHLHLIISALPTSLLRQQYWSLWLQHRVQSLQHWVVSKGDFIDEKHGAFFHGGDQRPINPLEQLVALRVLLHERKLIHDKDGTACGFESVPAWRENDSWQGWNSLWLWVLLCEGEMIHDNKDGTTCGFESPPVWMGNDSWQQGWYSLCPGSPVWRGNDSWQGQNSLWLWKSCVKGKWFMTTRTEQPVALRLWESSMIHDNKDITAFGSMSPAAWRGNDLWQQGQNSLWLWESFCVKGKWFTTRTEQLVPLRVLHVMTTKTEQFAALRVFLCKGEMIYHNQPFRQRSGWFILWCYLQETGLFFLFFK